MQADAPAAPEPASTGMAAAGRQRLRQQQRSASWGTLAEAGQAQPQRPIAPRFQPAGRRPEAPLMDAAGFPAAGRALPAVASGQPQASDTWRPRSGQPAAPRPLAWRPDTSPAAADAAGPDAAVAQLTELFGWAGTELAAAVLEAAGQDLEAAAAILADMVAPEAVMAAAAAAAQRAGSSGGSSGHSSESEGEEGEEETAAGDPYWRHRRHALRLSRQWQRAARGAAAAYAGACHSKARHLAAQAQRLRREALAAHAEAAERIETENNQHNRCGRKKKERMQAAA